MKRYRPRLSNGEWQVYDRQINKPILTGKKDFVVKRARNLNDGIWE